MRVHDHMLTPFLPMPAQPSVEQIARRYDRLAPIYPLFSLWLALPWSIRRQAVEELHLASGMRVLEVGCGTGRNFELVVDRVGPTGRVVGIDISPGMLGRARERARRNGWQQVEVVDGDATELPDMAPLDAVLFALSYSVLPEPQRTLGAAWQMMRPGGRIVVMDGAAPTGWARRVVAPLLGALSRVTVLGDPLSEPWQDLEELGGRPKVERLQFGTYFICAASKPIR